MAYSKIFRVRLVALSPIHIGCDDVYDPTSFIIDEKNKKLIHFKPQDFIKSLKEEEWNEFSELCSKGTVKSLIEIFKFIGATQVQGNENSVELCSGFLEHYKELKELTEELKELTESKIEMKMKQFVINRTAYNPNSQQPYIPGSSLKGSLRTAYLNLLARETRSAQSPVKKSKDLEERLLGGSFFSDPLRFLHISDLQPKEVSRKIVYSVNKKKKVSKYEPQGPFQILEAIQPRSVFEGTVEIVSPIGKAADLRVADSLNSLNPLKLFNAVKNFYIKSLFPEEEEIAQNIGTNLDLVKEGKDQSEKDESLHLVRIGRHSGAEAVTIEGHRNIKIMQKKGEKPKYEDHSTTVWLASDKRKPNNTANLLPFGWALLKFAKAG